MKLTHFISFVLVFPGYQSRMADVILDLVELRGRAPRNNLICISSFPTYSQVTNVQLAENKSLFKLLNFKLVH
jgi:hypothetical protein